MLHPRLQCDYVIPAAAPLSAQNDPWGAARYYAEAEKQEELEDNRAADIQVTDGLG